MANFEFRGYPTTFLLIKQKSQNFFYTYDPSQKSSDDLKIQNLPLIHLPISKRFSISGHFEDIFVNKVDFGHIGFIVKLPQIGRVSPHLLISFITHVKMKLRKDTVLQLMTLDMFILLAASEFKMAATALSGHQRSKIFCVVNLLHDWG